MSLKLKGLTEFALATVAKKKEIKNDAKIP